MITWKLLGRVRHTMIASLLFALLPMGAGAEEGWGVLHDVGALLRTEADNLITVEKAIGVDINLRSLEYATARKLQARLHAIVARTTHLHSFHSVRLLNNIDEYFTEPSPARWDLAKSDLLFMSLSLTDLLEEIARLDPTYRIQPTSWQGPLRERRVLERLAAIQPPATRQELTEFSRVRVQYTLLVRHLQQVNDGVDDYIGSGSRR